MRWWRTDVEGRWGLHVVLLQGGPREILQCASSAVEVAAADSRHFELVYGFFRLDQKTFGRVRDVAHLKLGVDLAVFWMLDPKSQVPVHNSIGFCTTHWRNAVGGI